MCNCLRHWLPTTQCASGALTWGRAFLQYFLISSGLRLQTEMLFDSKSRHTGTQIRYAVLLLSGLVGRSGQLTIPHKLKHRLVKNTALI